MKTWFIFYALLLSGLLLGCANEKSLRARERTDVVVVSSEKPFETYSSLNHPQGKIDISAHTFRKTIQVRLKIFPQSKELKYTVGTAKMSVQDKDFPNLLGKDVPYDSLVFPCKQSKKKGSEVPEKLIATKDVPLSICYSFFVNPSKPRFPGMMGYLNPKTFKFTDHGISEIPIDVVLDVVLD